MSQAPAPDADDYEGAFALLAEMTQGFARSAPLEETLRSALDSIVGHVGAESGSLWLEEAATKDLVCLASVGKNTIAGMRLAAGEGIVGKAVRERVCQAVFDVSQHPDFAQRIDDASGETTRSMLCSPMVFADRVVGAISLINKRAGDGRFQESDSSLLRVLASSAGLAIANAQLATAQVENETVRREVALAAEIQRSLLPERKPPPFPICGVNHPARTVSGDFFDILPLSRGRIAFCLGDVSGKGMNAALLMAKTASLYRCLARDAASPGVLLARLNDELCETATLGMFVTMVAGVLDVSRGFLRLANAGHEPPLLRSRAGEVVALDADAPPVGIIPGTPFPERDADLEGGVLYVFSDGLTEAGTATGEAFGSEGLVSLIARFADLSLGERVDAIAAEAGRLDLRDDLTLLAVSDEYRGDGDTPA